MPITAFVFIAVGFTAAVLLFMVIGKRKLHWHVLLGTTVGGSLVATIQGFYKIMIVGSNELSAAFLLIGGLSLMMGSVVIGRKHFS